MPVITPLHLPIAPAHDEALFVRQRDEYSCGVACLTTVARIYETAGIDYDALRDLLNPNPEVGSCNFKMADVSRVHLPFASAGEDSYTGGVGVANIMQDEGHYVVFLCAENGRVIYYDPYDHDLVVDDIATLNWVSESGHLTRWSVNFAPLPDNSLARWQAMAARA